MAQKTGKKLRDRGSTSKTNKRKRFF